MRFNSAGFVAIVIASWLAKLARKYVTPAQCEIAQATRSLIDSIHFARLEEITLALIWLCAVFMATYGPIIVAINAVQALIRLSMSNLI